MLRNRNKTLAVAIALTGIIGLAATAFADWGRGPGRWYGPGACAGSGAGYGYGQRGFACPAAYDDLNDDQIERLNRMRTEFFEDTRDLRDRMWEKREALRNELARQEPDEAKALDLQKEVSELKNQMAQKRLEQRLTLQKEFPELTDNRFGRGYGKGRGRGMWQDGFGRGYGMGPGYGRGGGCRY